MTSLLLKQAVGWIGLIVFWQLSSSWTIKFGLPGPAEICKAWLDISSNLFLNLGATIFSATLGLLIGTVVGAVLGLGLHTSLIFNRIFYGPVVALFALPSLVLSPLFFLLMPQGDTPVAMSAVTSFFPLAIAVRRGLADSNPDLHRLFRIAGATRLKLLWKLEIPTALPTFITGLQVASTWALLGSMLGEFAGGRWGIGVLMLGMLGRGDPASLWATALTMTIVALCGYAGLGLLRRALQWKFGLSGEIRDANVDFSGEIGFSALFGALVSAVVFAFFLKAILPLPSPLILDPWELILRITVAPSILAQFGAAFVQTMVLALVSLVIGLSAALFWAIFAHSVPALNRIISPIALVTQAVPLTAIAPLFILALGRGNAASITIAVLAIIFPAYSLILHRLEATPGPAITLFKIYAQSTIKQIRYLDLPWSIYAIFSSLRIAAPRVILGVMLAEYIATGKGLGFLLIEAKGRLEYEMIWLIIYVTAFIGIILFFVSALLEYRFTDQASRIWKDVD